MLCLHSFLFFDRNCARISQLSECHLRPVNIFELYSENSKLNSTPEDVEFSVFAFILFQNLQTIVGW
jgi:hypothetical protein